MLHRCAWVAKSIDIFLIPILVGDVQANNREGDLATEF
jgi:hypothetical protein